MKKIGLFLAATLLSTPAFAQDQENGFTGARAEVRIGVDIPKLTYTETDLTGTYKESGTEVGLLYGGEIGYDFPIGTTSFAGIYAGIEGANSKYCVSDGIETGCLKAGRNWSVGARVGFEASPRTAVYLKGGYANGRLRFTYEDAAFPVNNFKVGTNRDGFQIGAGVEAKIGTNSYAKFEYVYNDYAAHKERFGAVDYRLGLTRHQLSLGLGVRF